MAKVKSMDHKLECLFGFHEWEYGEWYLNIDPAQDRDDPIEGLICGEKKKAGNTPFGNRYRILECKNCKIPHPDMRMEVEMSRPVPREYVEIKFDIDVKEIKHEESK